MNRIPRVLVLGVLVSVAMFAAARSAHGGPVDWYHFVGQQLGPGVSDGRLDPSFNGSTDATDYRNWYSYAAGWAPNIAAVEATYNSRFGFTSCGGYGEVGSSGNPNWFSGSPSINYPSGTNPATCIIGPGQSLNFGTSTGAIMGDVHVSINGGSLTCGDLTDNTYYGILLPPQVTPPSYSYTAYQWANTIDVLNGGSFTAANVYGFFQGGAPAHGHLTLGIRGEATVDLDKFAAGHMGAGANGGTDGAGAGNNGLGGGGLILEGSGATITIDTLNFFPTNLFDMTGRNAFNSAPKLEVVLDGTVADRVFNTVVANILEIDSTYVCDGGTALDQALDIVVTLAGYSATAGDVIPVVTANTLQMYDGNSTTTGVLGNVTVNGSPLAWGGTFSVGGTQMTLLDHDPAAPGQAGVFLEVVPEPGTMSLLVLGGLGVLIRRRKA